MQQFNLSAHWTDNNGKAQSCTLAVMGNDLFDAAANAKVALDNDERTKGAVLDGFSLNTVKDDKADSSEDEAGPMSGSGG